MRVYKQPRPFRAHDSDASITVSSPPRQHRRRARTIPFSVLPWTTYSTDDISSFASAQHRRSDRVQTARDSRKDRALNVSDFG